MALVLGILKRKSKVETKSMIRKYPVGRRVPPNQEIEQLIKNAVHQNEEAVRKLKRTV